MKFINLLKTSLILLLLAGCDDSDNPESSCFDVVELEDGIYQYFRDGLPIALHKFLKAGDNLYLEISGHLFQYDIDNKKIIHQDFIDFLGTSSYEIINIDDDPNGGNKLLVNLQVFTSTGSYQKMFIFDPDTDTYFDANIEKLHHENPWELSNIGLIYLNDWHSKSSKNDNIVLLQTFGDRIEKKSYISVFYNINKNEFYFGKDRYDLDYPRLDTISTDKDLIITMKSSLNRDEYELFVNGISVKKEHRSDFVETWVKVNKTQNYLIVENSDGLFDQYSFYDISDRNNPFLAKKVRLNNYCIGSLGGNSVDFIDENTIIFSGYTNDQFLDTTIYHMDLFIMDLQTMDITDTIRVDDNLVF